MHPTGRDPEALHPADRCPEAPRPIPLRSAACLPAVPHRVLPYQVVPTPVARYRATVVRQPAIPPTRCPAAADRRAARVLAAEVPCPIVHRLAVCLRVVRLPATRYPATAARRQAVPPIHHRAAAVMRHRAADHNQAAVNRNAVMAHTAAAARAQVTVLPRYLVRRAILIPTADRRQAQMDRLAAAIRA